MIVLGASGLRSLDTEEARLAQGAGGAGAREARSKHVLYIGERALRLQLRLALLLHVHAQDFFDEGFDVAVQRLKVVLFLEAGTLVGDLLAAVGHEDDAAIVGG